MEHNSALLTPSKETDEDLLPKVPANIVVDRHSVLHTALVKLNSVACREQLQAITDLGLYTCTLVVEIPPHRLCFVRSEKTFHGVSTVSSELAIQQAHKNALAYLEDNSLITIDDISVKKVKKLASATTWANLFEEKLSALQLAMLAVKAMHQNILLKIHNACADLLDDDLPLTFTTDGSTENIGDMPPILYTGPTPAKSSKDRLAGCLADVYEQIRQPA